jgi:hypothetical protein
VGQVIDPKTMQGTWWAQYDFVPTAEKPWVGQWMRIRVLKLAAIQDDRFLFSIYPSKLWCLMSGREAKELYDRGYLKPMVITGGKHEADSQIP